MEGELQSGFELPLMKLAVITEEELFKTELRKAEKAEADKCRTDQKLFRASGR